MGFALWAVLVVAGLVWLRAEGTTAGTLREPPALWPAQSSLPAPADRPALVMFLHPKCDCSRASLTELAEIMARSNGRARAFVVFLRPEGVTDGWDETASWDQAGRLPNTERLRDLNGAEAALFHADTSGELVVYDAHRQLRFSGGITSQRGHPGDNVGRRQVLAVLNDAPAAGEPVSHPVFGCALHTPSAGQAANQAATR